MELSNGFVILMGMGVVFVGLIAIIILCSITGLILRDRKTEKKADDTVAQPTASVENYEIPNKQQFVAAVSAVIAEELGKDISAIRIHSIKKI